MTAPLVAGLAPVRGARMVASVAWQRSWGFTVSARRDTQDHRRTSKTWKSRWLLVWLQALASFPLQFAATAASARQVVVLKVPGAVASARVRPVPDRRRAEATEAMVTGLVVTVELTAFLAIGLVVVWWAGTVAVWVVMVVLVALAALWLGIAIREFASLPSRRAVSHVAAIFARSVPVVVVSDVVAYPVGAGAGSSLMQSLTEDWCKAEPRPRAVLRAASSDLVRFYGRLGWVLENAQHRVMAWRAGS